MYGIYHYSLDKENIILLIYSYFLLLFYFSFFIAIDEGVYYTDERKQSGLLIRSLDVSLVCIETPTKKASVFAAPLDPIDEKLSKMVFNIYNNIWDTNYIFWYPYEDSNDDFKARYSIEFLHK